MATAPQGMAVATARATGPPDPRSLPRVAAGARVVPHDMPPAGPVAVVDGRVPDATLELSHWPGCSTHPWFAATTATEVVDRYLRTRAGGPAVPAVTNNHYDVDGVLALWMLVERPAEGSPERALAIAAAAAGDFGVWSDPWALRAAVALVALADPRTTPLRAVRDALADTARDPSGALNAALVPRAGRVLRDPERFARLWRPAWDAIAAEAALVAAGDVRIEDVPDLDLAVVRAPRRLGRAAVCPATDRSHLLHVSGDGTVVLEQRYETWVAFASRPRGRMDLAATAAALQAEETAPGGWAFDGLAQSTPLLTLRDPRGAPAPTGLAPERILEVVRATAVRTASGEPSATLGGGTPDPAEAE